MMAHSYHDSYVGEADFLGQELVYRDRRPVWSMAYYGYLLDPEHIDAGQAGLVVVGVSDMGAKIEREMKKARKVEARQLKADTAGIEADAKSAQG